MFYFHPDLGKIPILTNIFQMGWNHQQAKVLFFAPPETQAQQEPFGVSCLASPS